MPHRSLLARHRLRWPGLLALSALFALGLDALHLPAGLLLGPMVAAIVFALAGAQAYLPRPAFVAAQGVIGCLIARGIPVSFLSTLADHWAVFVFGVLAVSVLATGLGWLLSQWRVLPGTTAVWGSTPGGAAAMVIMAEAYGADVRLVAFMQYLRVACVTISASLFAHWWIHSGPEVAAPASLLASLLRPPARWDGLLATLVLALGGSALGARLRLPAGGLLLPLVAGIAMQDGAGIPIQLPPALLAVAYACIGWTIGARFNREVLALTLRSLPKLLASVITLIVLCGLFAAALVRWAHVDPLTAFLATSPGGADSVAIIAASSPVDMPFVLTMQVLRMLFVMATGPAIARLLAERLQRRGH